MAEVNKHTGEVTYYTQKEFRQRIKSLDINIELVFKGVNGPNEYYESSHAWFRRA